MKIIILLLVYIALSRTQESDKEAASFARYLVRNSNVGVFSSQIFGISSFSIASLEDFAESSKMDGNLIFMLADISKTSYNLKENPFGSFSIAAPNCSEADFHGMPYDPLACIRFTLVGKFSTNGLPVNTTDPEFMAFLKKHPASIDWIKYSDHIFNMWSLEQIYGIEYVGGYGDLHYIGTISAQIYLAAKPVKPN